MTKSKQTNKTDTLAKTSKKGSVELSEKALDKASGGAVFPSGPSQLKYEASLNFSEPNALLPAVKPVG
jgi:hypothetical protein